MEFKIDTKPVYTTIIPAADLLDANLAAAINAKCRELSGNGSHHFIIDLSECRDADASAFQGLSDLHEQCYNNGQSLVFTGISGAVSDRINDHALPQMLNITPTIAEAVDIISMEILERDLFNEE